MVIDSTIFIQHLRARDRNKTELTLLNTPNVFVSSVTLYELFMGATDFAKWQDVTVVTQNIPILDFNGAIAEESARIFHALKAVGQLIEFRDIFIAATALVHRMPVKNLNKKHFTRISGLQVL
jgi:predicted nucleic acid-binding protein